MQMFFLFFHPVPQEIHLSCAFHPPFFLPCNYSFCNQAQPILCLVCHQHMDEIKCDFPTHVHLLKLFSNRSIYFCNPDSMPINKMLLSVPMNREQELHCQDVEP